MKPTAGRCRTLVQIAPLVLLAGLLVAAWLTVDGTTDAAHVTDLAGHQRFLSRAVLTSAQGIALGHPDEQIALTESLDELRMGFDALDEGGLWQGRTLPPVPDEARGLIQDARLQLDVIAPAALALSAPSGAALSDPERAQASLLTIRFASDRLIAVSDELVDVMSRDTDRHARQLTWILAAAIAASLGLFVFLLSRTLRNDERQRVAVASLSESEGRFRQLADNIAEVFWIKSADGGEVVYVSPAFDIVFGRSGAQLMKSPRVWMDAVHPSDRERVAAAYAMAPEGGFDSEYRIERADHSVRWIRDRGFPVRNDAGEVYRIAGIATDVTERKQAEDQAVAAQDALDTQASMLTLVKQQLAAVVEHLPDGVCLLGPDQKVVRRNRRGRDYMKRLGDIDFGAVISQDPGHPVELDSTDTSETFVVSAAPLREGKDGWVIAIRDVSSERASQEQRQQRDHLASVGQLAAGIAHDFNNLLTVMIGTAQTLERSGRLVSSEREQLRQISIQGERATGLVRQILDFSRATAVERKPLDLVPFVGEMVRMVERVLPETIEIDVDIGVETCLIEGNLSQLQQMLTNLVANSRDAMQDGGTLRIELGTVRVSTAVTAPVAGLDPGDYAVWTVSDTGSGIEPGVIGRVFEPFFTTKSPGLNPGLGLAQLYGIVMQHDGLVDVSSQPGRGATFTIYLPLTESIPTTRAGAGNAMPMGGHETVLLVEDEEQVRDAVKAMLEALQYEVIATADGREALSVFAEHRGDIGVVLTDVVMPEMGGLELWAALRVRDRNVPVIAMSGYPLGTFEGHDEGSALPDEIAGYLHKPVVLYELAQALERALHHPPHPGRAAG